MKELAKVDSRAATISAVLLQGDLSKLTEAEKVGHYNSVCASLALNPLTKPFDYIKLNGKEQLYARKDATDQLRQIHKISIKILSREKDGDLYVVTARAVDGDGREDEATGVLSLKGLSGEALSNAMMKCETKAKRRVTLSICGLGFFDETEIETIDTTARDLRAQEIQKQLQDTPSSPEFESHDFDFPTPDVTPSLGDYVIKAGKNKGKKLKDITDANLNNFIVWADQQDSLHPDVAEYRDKALAYLEGKSQ